MKMITTLNGLPELQSIDNIWAGYCDPATFSAAEGSPTEARSLQIDADALPVDFQDHLQSIGLILLHLPVFTDGRPYSLAAMLRQHYQFAGEIRVFGDVRQEQLDHLHRCGINSFVLKPDEDLDAALGRIGFFSKGYQANVSH